MKLDWMAIVAGIVIMIFGGFIMVVTKFAAPAVFWGAISIIVGIAVILYSGKENEIEQIKTHRRKK